MNKKFILLASVAVLALGITSESWAAKTTLPDSGTCGNGCKYEVTTVNGERILTVSNDSNYDSSQQLSIKESAFDSYEYTNVNFDKINITGNFESIGNYAFYENHAKSVNIPDSVKSIGRAAFSVNDLTELNLPKELESIGMNAFNGSKLTSVEIPNNVTSIGEQAFYGNQLKELTLPEGLESIGNSAFWGNQLASVEIPNSVTSIGDYAFSTNQLSKLTLPEGLESIGKSAFWGNQLTSVEIPDSVMSIGDYAFQVQGYYDENGQWVPTLTDVKLGDSLESIGRSAFSGAKIENLVIPASVSLNPWAITLSDYGANIVCKGSEETCAALLNNTTNVRKLGYFTADTDGAGRPDTTYADPGTFTNINIAKDEQCNSAVYYYSGESCLKRSKGINCTGGYAKLKGNCVDPLKTFAKKHWTPAEANEWLNEDDNTVTLTFKKQ